MNDEPPPDHQADQESSEYHASSEELAGIDRGLEDARNGRFASEENVKAAFGRFCQAKCCSN